MLSVRNAAVDHGVATAPAQYHGTVVHLRQRDRRLARDRRDVEPDHDARRRPPALPDAAGAYVRVDIWSEHPEHKAWATPVETYFRRDAAGWTLVGLTRLQ